MPVVALLAPLAWLVGTFPTAVIAARLSGRDVLREGSGNPGATNVGRLIGWRWGIVVLLVDFCKGAACAGVGLWVDGRAGAIVLGLAAVVGHMFPLYRKGGKGVATAGGALTVLYPWIVVVLAAAWFLIARVFHKASLASIVIVIAFPVAVAATGHEIWEDIVVAALAVVILARHAGNIRRLIRHEENDLDSRNK